MGLQIQYSDQCMRYRCRTMVYSICRTIIYRYSAVVYTCNRVVSYSHSAVVSYSYRYINVVSIGRNYTFVLHAKGLHEVHT